MKIADFGLVKVMNSTERLTQTGVAMGTPAYMSPEQIRQSKDVTQTSDVFALGCILYEMLCGNRAFEGLDTFETLHAVISQMPIQLDEIKKNNPWMGSLLEGMLQKSIQDRIPDGIELQRLFRTKEMWTKAPSSETFIFDALSEEELSVGTEFDNNISTSEVSSMTSNKISSHIIAHSKIVTEETTQMTEASTSDSKLYPQKTDALYIDRLSWVIITVSGCIILSIVFLFILYINQVDERTIQIREQVRHETKEPIDTEQSMIEQMVLSVYNLRHQKNPSTDEILQLEQKIQALRFEELAEFEILSAKIDLLAGEDKDAVKEILSVLFYPDQQDRVTGNEQFQTLPPNIQKMFLKQLQISLQIEKLVKQLEILHQIQKQQVHNSENSLEQKEPINEFPILHSTEENKE